MVKIASVGCMTTTRTPQEIEKKRNFYKRFLRSDTEISFISPKGINTPDCDVYAYHQMYGKELLKAYKRAEIEGYDAIIQGCSYDILVREAREIIKIPIIGALEAAVHIASLLSDKFSVIYGRRKWAYKMNEEIRTYGLWPKVASWTWLKDEKGKGFTPAILSNEPERVEKVLIKTAKKCIYEDGAEAIVLPCGGFERYWESLKKELGVPVTFPSLAALKIAELLAELNKIGLKISRVGTYYIPKERLEGVEAALK